MTGATGMVGAHLIRHLSESGYQNIVGIRRESSDMGLVLDYLETVEWKNAEVRDITDWDFLQAGDIVVHTAAIVSLADNAVQEMYDVNINGTENLVNASLRAGIKKFIFLSSIAAIGRKKNGELTDEAENFDQSADNSPYSKSKYASERHVWRGQQEGLNTLILNPSVILGAGFWKKSSAVIIDRTAQGLPFYPKGTAGFVDVRDVAKACILAIESNLSNERIILNGFNIEYKKFFSLLTQKLGVKMPTKALPDWMGNIFWRWERLKYRFTGLAPAVTRHTVNSTRKQTRYDNNKSKELLNLDYYSVERTLSDITDSYLKSMENKQDYALLEFD